LKQLAQAMAKTILQHRQHADALDEQLGPGE
jgi:hypothetical protein